MHMCFQWFETPRGSRSLRMYTCGYLCNLCETFNGWSLMYACLVPYTCTEYDALHVNDEWLVLCVRPRTNAFILTFAAWTKWQTFFWRHFEIHDIECSVNTGSGSVLAPSKSLHEPMMILFIGAYVSTQASMNQVSAYGIARFLFSFI